MTTYYLTNCSIFTGEKWLQNHSVKVMNGKISAIVKDDECLDPVPLIDLEGNQLLPGFVDNQIYGADGLLFSENLSVDALLRIEKAIVQSGTTSFLITLPTVPFADIKKAIEVIRDYQKVGMGALIGLHVEGPYINPEKKGAHKEQWIKSPEPDEVEFLIAAAKEGIVRIITLAPEKVDKSVIKRFFDANIVVSVGHTNATYEEYMEAFEAGCQHVTHLFNAMPQLEGRKPGLLAAISDSPFVRTTIIADGQHVNFASLRLAKKLLTEQIYLITDAVTLTDRLHLKNGAYYNEKDILTGSAMTMPLSVHNIYKHGLVSRGEAIRMATVYPAKALHLAKQIGRIQEDGDASFTVLDNHFGLKMVILKGKVVG